MYYKVLSNISTTCHPLKRSPFWNFIGVDLISNRCNQRRSIGIMKFYQTFFKKSYSFWIRVTALLNDWGPVIWRHEYIRFSAVPGRSQCAWIDTWQIAWDAWRQNMDYHLLYFNFEFRQSYDINEKIIHISYRWP